MTFIGHPGYQHDVGRLFPTRFRAAAPSARHAREVDHLEYIRATLERAGAFTAVSGRGQTLVGVIGLGGAAAAAQTESPAGWLAVWIVTGFVAVGVAAVAIARKARAMQVSLASGPARRFALGFFPSLLAGAGLTLPFYRHGLIHELPGVWLLVYGAAVTAGGALSIRIVPIMGGAFMLFGAAALAAPPGWGNAFMAAGFGGLHIVFGVIIAVKHGG